MFYVLFKAEFEIGKGLFENLENSKSDLPNFWKFENWKSFQMNEPFIIKYFQKKRKYMHFFKCSQKIMKKLKTQAKIPKKPQKPATPVEMNWRKIVPKKA